MLFIIEMVQDDTFALGLLLYGTWHFLAAPIGHLASMVNIYLPTILGLTPAAF